MNHYKKLEKEVIVKIKNAKRGMEKKLANSGNNNAKTFANYIKSKTKSHTGIGPLKDLDGKLITEDKEMSESFLRVSSHKRTQATSLYGGRKLT